MPWALALLAAGCGGGGEGVVQTASGNYQVLAGQVEKGALLRGSTVTINTLTTAQASLSAGTTTALPNTSTATLPALVPSGASFTMEVKDDFGSFAPQSAAIFQSAFVETTAEGYYFNELTGQRSDDYIALRGLSNLRTDSAINVNLLTDLSKERTLALARTAAGSGTVTSEIFNTARQQAQMETLRAFNIGVSNLGTVSAFSEMDLKRISTETTARPADNILLALSALAMQIGQDGSGVSDFINRFEADLADNGVIDDTTLRAQILQASAAADFDRVAANMNSFYKTSKFVAADIAQWVDRSGGTIGLLQKDVQYIPNLAFVSGTNYGSKAFNVATTDATKCYGVEVNDTRLGSAQLMDGSAAIANGVAYPAVGATATASLWMRFRPTDPNAVGYLVRWDQVSGACSTTTQTNKVKLLAYAAVPSDVALFLNRWATDFASCFSLTPSARVLAVDNTVPTTRGGPNVTSMAAACKPLFVDQARTGTKYLNNGYEAGQAFYSLLNDSAMGKGARTRGVTILRSTTAASPPLAAKPTMVVNVAYQDRFGRNSNLVLVAQKFTGTSAETGDWWVTGNQQPVDINVVPMLRKFTSVANVTTTPTTKEHFRTALGFFIYPFGPGGQLADGRPLTAVRITGSGVSGLVYVPPVQTGQTWMDVSNTAGDVATAATRRCGATVGSSGPTFTNCPYFWVARTTTVVPSSAAPVKRSPVSTDGSCATAATVNQSCAWGGTWSPTDISASLVRNAPFTVELFYGGSTTPTYTYSKYLNAPIADLTRAHTAGWVALDATTVTNARPLAGQTALALSWTGHVLNQNEVRSATVTLANAAASVATPDDPVARDAFSAVVAPGQEIQYAVPTASPGATNQRSILLNMRTWDTSGKSLWFSYDTVN